MTANLERRLVMFDPGALGTLLVGLDAIRAREGDGQPRHRPPRRGRGPRFRAVRLATASTLRRLADAVERPARRETAAAPGPC